MKPPSKKAGEKNNLLTETIICGDNAFGCANLPKRTWWRIIRATLYLKYWDLRLWLAKYGLFCKKVKYINEKGEESTAKLIY